MDASTCIERSLQQALAAADGPDLPPRLARALRHAVFPGGARIRPRLCLAVARACGDDGIGLSEAAGTSIELMHCASLVHDDLPCFDDADTRRGRPSVHRAFGEALAVLVGDGLIVLAFETLARAATRAPARLPALLGILARASGAPSGIVAGQGWELEPQIVLANYHRAKTGALFAGASAAGAASVGNLDPRWATFGERLGEAYQVADDVRDVASNARELGKPTGRDAALGRPSAVAEFGLGGAIALVGRLVGDALDAVPECPGAGELKALVRADADRLLPQHLRPAA